MKTKSEARFDTRLPKEQKEFFEYAATIGGFRTLTEFVVYSVQKRAEQIVEEHDKIIASKRDKEIFFDAMMNPPKPLKNLRKAAARYQEAIGE